MKKRQIIKPGMQCYFDLLGKTNRPEITSVTVISKKKFRDKYMAIVDDTREIISVSGKYLTPINDEAPVINISHPNMCFPYTNRDHLMLQNLISFYTDLRKHAVHGKVDDEIKDQFFDVSNIDAILNSLRLIDNKLLVHLVSIGEIERVETLKDIAIKKDEESRSQNNDNGKNNWSVDIKKLMSQFYQKLDEQKFNSIEETKLWMTQNFPKDVIINNPTNPRILNDEDIENFAGTIVNFLEESDNYSSIIMMYLVPNGKYFMTKSLEFEFGVDYDEVFEAVKEVIVANNMLTILPKDIRDELRQALPEDKFNSSYLVPFTLSFIGMCKKDGGGDNDD